QPVALSADIADMTERHQVIRNMIAWSYHLLDSDSQQLFRRLGVFPESWTTTTARHICFVSEELDVPSYERLLESLCDHQLILRTEGPEHAARWHMLVLLREYAREQLRESGEMEKLQSAHARYYLERARRLPNELLILVSGEQKSTEIDLVIAEI